MARKPIVIGNWKAQLSPKGEIELTRAIKNQLRSVKFSGDIVVCPSGITLALVNDTVGKSNKIQIGAQNVYWEDKGAFTGQTTVTQIRPFADWCIVGHSEVRRLLTLSEELVVQTANHLLRDNIIPIICIGETEEERQSDQAIAKIQSQVMAMLNGLDRSYLARTVIAYEPIWAIGSGVLPEPDDVAQAVLLIRKLIADRYKQNFAERVRIIYGGSIKADLAAKYVGGPLADGLLVGGASIHPQQFVTIVDQVENAVG